MSPEISISAIKSKLNFFRFPILGVGAFRLLLAAAVLIQHAFPDRKNNPPFNFISGGIAVETFFIISGFYMALILTEKYNFRNSYRLFISNRLLRILPLFYLILAISVLVPLLFHFLIGKDIFIFQFWTTGKIQAILYAIFFNLFIFGREIASFLFLDSKTGNILFSISDLGPKLLSFQSGIFVSQAWALSLELMFYLIAPFIVRLKNNYILCITAISLIIRSLMFSTMSPDQHAFIYKFFPAELLFFLLGVLSYKLLHNLNREKLEKYIPVFFALILFIFTSFYTFKFMHRDWLYFAAVILFLPTIFNFSKKSGADRYLGELSYPVYLCHNFIILLLISLFGFKHNTVSLIIISMTASIILSVLLYNFFLKPIENFRQKRLSSKCNINYTANQ